MIAKDNIITFDVKGDERGSLIALEENYNVPFDVRRVFYIYGTDQSISRGNHAHYKTKQLLVSVSGSCSVTLDDGEGCKQTFVLDKPSIGLFQDAMIWGTMQNFSENCVLLVLADSHYDESDYIRDYSNFFNLINGG